MSTTSDWSRLEKIEAAIAWHREPENLPLAHVWHTDTVAELATALRRLLELDETDQRLISLLWNNVPGDNRVEVINALEAPGSHYVDGTERLSVILNNDAHEPEGD